MRSLRGPAGIDQCREVERAILDDAGVGDHADLRCPAAGLRIDQAEPGEERIGILRPGHPQHDDRPASGVLCLPPRDLGQGVFSTLRRIDLAGQIDADLTEIFVGGRIGLPVPIRRQPQLDMRGVDPALPGNRGCSGGGWIIDLEDQLVVGDGERRDLGGVGGCRRLAEDDEAVAPVGRHGEAAVAERPTIGRQVDGVARDDVDRQIVAGDQAFRRRRCEGGLLRPIRTVDFRAVLAGFVLCLCRIRRDGHGAGDASHRIDVGELAGAWNQGMKGTGADIDQPQRRQALGRHFVPARGRAAILAMHEAVVADRDLVLADAGGAIAIVAQLQDQAWRRITFQEPVFDAAVAGLVVAGDAAFVRRFVRLVGEAEVQFSQRRGSRRPRRRHRAAGHNTGLAGLAHRPLLRVRDGGGLHRPEPDADDRTRHEQE